MPPSVPKNKSKGCLKGCLIIFLIGIGSFIFLCIAAVILVPDSNSTNYKKANRLYEEGNHKKALKLVDKTIKRDSINPEYRLLKGMILSELDDTITSEKEISIAEKFSNTDSSKQIVFKKIIDWRIQKNDTAKAEKLVQYFLKPVEGIDFRNYDDSYYYVANTMALLGKPKQASSVLVSFIDSIQTFKNDTINFKRAHYQVSEILLNLKDTIQSIKVLKKLIQEYPNTALAYKNLGNTYFTTQSDVKAIQYFKKYIVLDTSDALVYKRTGQSYLRLRKKKSAKKYLRIATKKGDLEACIELRELTAKTRYYTRTKCCDGTTSSSTGRGTCSHHRGVCGTEYIPYKEYTMNCN
ncbi:tetratricopeptide repeat protein [uncultured Aquimarina sp.]|uniref:tetratricopeptide repeat protein n=1 Tax=uncultured Aquimarina sp. TaxID=575652 RepID=UPI0026114A89|nr:tetratricopeptide repeat protein [uncultured Aquimarina sp.]